MDGAGRGLPGGRWGGGGAESAAKPWLRQVRAGQCPVPSEDQKWIERRMWWCVKQFGRDVVRRPTALPTPEFFPGGSDGQAIGPVRADQVDELVRRICSVMGADADSFTVTTFETPEDDPRSLSRGRRKRHAVGHYRTVDGRGQVELDMAEAGEPTTFAALIAHELGHARLIGERRIDSRDGDQEKLTDLVAVYLGMGIFSANAAYRFTKSVQGWSVLPTGGLSERELMGTRLDPTWRLGYLTERQFGYALACYCLLRDETDPPWARHLDPGARTVLKQGLEYFARHPKV